jgi:hypothetical protein
MDIAKTDNPGHPSKKQDLDNILVRSTFDFYYPTAQHPKPGRSRAPLN